MVFSLRILTILAFVLIFAPFNKASAEGGVNYIYGTFDNGYSNYNNGSYYNTNQASYQAPIYTPPPTTTPIVYSNSANPNVASTTTVPKTVAKAKTTSAPKTVALSTTKSNSVGGLAANAFFGSNSFLPSGLIQWILFAIFILLLVILTRKIFGAKENYHATPMKHE